MAVRVPLRVLPKEPATDQSGHVDLFLRQAGDAVRPFTLRLRNGITVPKGGSLRADGVHSALVAGDGPVAEFLADAEPPAHDTWTVTSRLRQRWRYAQQTLTLIRTLPQRLHALLATGADQELPDELLDYFWFEDEGERTSGKERGGRRAPRRTPPRPETPPASRPCQLVVLEEKGGFTLKAGPGLADVALPCRIRLRMAYDREDKDPIQAWSRYDFDLADEDGEIEVEADGAEMVERAGNALLVEALDRAFRVRLSGFDVNRDLEVRCHRLREDTV